MNPKAIYCFSTECACPRVHGYDVLTFGHPRDEKLLVWGRYYDRLVLILVGWNVLLMRHRCPCVVCLPKVMQKQCV